MKLLLRNTISIACLSSLVLASPVYGSDLSGDSSPAEAERVFVEGVGRHGERESPMRFLPDEEAVVDALHISVEFGYVEHLREYGEATGKGLASIGDEKLRSLLLVAAMHGQTDAARYLVREGAKPDLGDRSGNIDTPMELAIEMRYPDTVLAMLEEMSDSPKRKVRRALVREAVGQELFWLAERLLEKGYDYVSLDFHRRIQDLAKCLARGRVKLADEIDPTGIIPTGFVLDQNPDLVHDVAAGGTSDMMEYLFRKGYPMEKKDEIGRTPWMRASEAGNRANLEWLAKHGFEKELSTVASNPSDKRALRAMLEDAVVNGTSDEVGRLLSKDWVPHPRFRERELRKLLNLAAGYGRTDTALLLMRNGAPAQPRYGSGNGKRDVFRTNTSPSRGSGRSLRELDELKRTALEHGRMKTAETLTHQGATVFTDDDSWPSGEPGRFGTNLYGRPLTGIDHDTEALRRYEASLEDTFPNHIDPGSYVRHPDERNALYLAILHGHWRTLRAMLEELDHKPGLLARNTIVAYAISKHRLDIAVSLVKLGYRYKPDRGAERVRHMARCLYEGYFELAEKVDSVWGVRPRKILGVNEWLVHKHAAFSSPRELEYLMNKGFPMEFVSSEGSTPLEAALAAGNQLNAQWLSEYQID